MTTTPYQFIKRGNLFVTPVGPAISEVPYPTQSFDRPPDYSLWVHGRIQEPGPFIDRARLSPRLYQEVRDDLVRYSPVEVTRSAIRRSSHAYVGVIDSRGTPYYFALDSRGVSVREADDAAWKAFDRLAVEEHMAGVRQRRGESATEMQAVDRELSAPAASDLVVTKGTLRYGREIDWERDVPRSSWWRHPPRSKRAVGGRKTEAEAPREAEGSAEKAVAAEHPRSRPRTGGERRSRYPVDAHEAAGGIAVGRTRIRGDDGRGAAASSEVPHYQASPDHAVGGPGHRVAGDPEAGPKPRGTTSIWRPGDDARRAAARPAERAPSRMRRKRMMYGKGGDADLIALAEGPGDEARRRAGNRYAAEYRRVGHELWLQIGEGESEPDPPRPEDALYVDKALPRKGGEEKAKKAPSSKASKKKAGATGKTRYTYPGEKKKKTTATAQKPAPLVVVHSDHKHADPAELANQLGVSVRTLERAARRLGRDGFATFMRSRLKRFAAKHRLDPDYWGTLYAAMLGPENDPVAKSDDEAAWKQFGHNVKEAASSVPHDHAERFGDRKVFIHHVHSVMKEHGTYSGSLEKFKEHVVAAHQKGHVDASRADFVSAMNPHSVRRSETDAKGATFHFINNAKHDPEAAKRLSGSKPGGAAKRAPKMSRAFHREVARVTSQEAHEATEHAQRTGTAAAHAAAATAHHHAGVAHQKASGRVNDKTAGQHFDQAMVHSKAARPS